MRHSCHKCTSCGTYCLCFTALTPIGQGRLLTVDDLPADAILGPPAKKGKLISFDGGAGKSTDGHTRAGAGAVLWSPLSSDGKRLPLAAAMAVCPSLPDSTAAEAMGLTLALALCRYAKDPHNLTIIGDNLPLVRFAAGNGKPRTDLMWLLAGASLLAAAPLLTSTVWEAVRRCFNRGADRLATLAVKKAKNGAGPCLYYDGPGLVDDDFSLCPCRPVMRHTSLCNLCLARKPQARPRPRQLRGSRL